MSTDWKSIVQAVAPTLATVLGGPLAGTAVAALSQQLLGKPDGTQEQVAAAVIAASPADLVKIKTAELEYAKALSDAGIRLEEIAAGDRASARDREIRAADSWTPRVLAALVVVGWLAVQWFLLHNIVDQTMRELVARVLGTLDGALMLVLSYYFGSSASSRAKDDALSKIAQSP